MEGTIKKLTDKGFGFIATPDGQDVFFHARSLPGEFEEFENLQEGMSVQFEIVQGEDGRTRAEQIVIGDMVEAPAEEEAEDEDMAA